MMMKNKKMLKDANEEMAKFLGGSNVASPTDDADADADADSDDDDDDDEFPPTIPRAGV
jgi:hypothetical protein